MAAKKAAPIAPPPKKAAPKKGAKKGTAAAGAPSRKATSEKMGTEEKGSVIDRLIAVVNKEFKGEVIRRAGEASTSHTLRRPTGIPDLDIALAGGFPASALSVVTGPDGAGKDYIINCMIREVQNNYGKDAKVCIYSTEFPYDKKFAKDLCGVQVGFSEEEIEELEQARLAQGHPNLTEAELQHYRSQVGEILLVQGVVADHGLYIVLAALETGAFQLIAINSLGVFETAAKDGTDSLEEHAAQSSEAQLLSRFIPKMFMLLNRPILQTTERNLTTLIAANQVRANRDMPRARPGMPVPQHMKYQPGSGSRALAHGKAIDVMLHKGTVILDKEVDPPQVLGRTINWELTKGKLGTHDSRKGSYDFYFDGGADLASNLLSAGVRYDVIQQAAAWYSYQGPDGMLLKANGADNATNDLRQDAIMSKAIYDDVLRAAGVVCRYK